MANDQFEIRTDKPHKKVSWQVTGIRKVAYVEKNRIQVEVDKRKKKRGLSSTLKPLVKIRH